ncbi:MAG: DUF3761 domain-containing protein, partial [Burkholderiales bacterium]
MNACFTWNGNIYKALVCTLPKSSANQTWVLSVITRCRVGVAVALAAGLAIPAPGWGQQPPDGATARCGDGTYSTSSQRQGTCSRHG